MKIDELILDLFKLFCRAFHRAWSRSGDQHSKVVASVFSLVGVMKGMSGPEGLYITIFRRDNFHATVDYGLVDIEIGRSVGHNPKAYGGKIGKGRLGAKKYKEKARCCKK